MLLITTITLFITSCILGFLLYKVNTKYDELQLKLKVTRDYAEDASINLRKARQQVYRLEDVIEKNSQKLYLYEKNAEISFPVVAQGTETSSKPSNNRSSKKTRRSQKNRSDK